MGLLESILGTKDDSISGNQLFWDWFKKNEKGFRKVLKNQGNIERDFFSKISPKLNELREGYWFLAGMIDNETVELIFTADGVIKNIVFVEELVASAPDIKGWKFKALKPAMAIDDVSIIMGELEFKKENIAFYSNDFPEYPDEIDITIVHKDYHEEIQDSITNGTYIFIDNYLGELNSVTSIDNLQIIGKNEISQELIPIEKLKDFLIWREKEFVERYEGIVYSNDEDSFNSLEATLENDLPLFAMVNSGLLNWDGKASHPWILSIEIKYEGDDFGMPAPETYDLMNVFEDDLLLELRDEEGYLNIGRQTADGSREIYFACKDFRLPSKMADKFQIEYRDQLIIDFDIYKDKYWQSFERFRPGFI